MPSKKQGSSPRSSAKKSPAKAAVKKSATKRAPRKSAVTKKGRSKSVTPAATVSPATSRRAAVQAAQIPLLEACGHRLPGLPYACQLERGHDGTHERRISDGGGVMRWSLTGYSLDGES